MWVRSLDGEDPLEKEMATHFSIFAWEIHGQRCLAGYSPWGHKESDTTEQLTHTLRLVTLALLVAQMVKNLPAVREAQVQSLCQEDPWRRKWQLTPVFLSGKSHGQRSLEGYSHGVAKNWTQLSD